MDGYYVSGFWGSEEDGDDEGDLLEKVMGGSLVDKCL